MRIVLGVQSLRVEYKVFSRGSSSSSSLSGPLLSLSSRNTRLLSSSDSLASSHESESLSLVWSEQKPMKHVDSGHVYDTFLVQPWQEQLREECLSGWLIMRKPCTMHLIDILAPSKCLYCCLACCTPWLFCLLVMRHIFHVRDKALSSVDFLNTLLL